MQSELITLQPHFYGTKKYLDVADRKFDQPTHHARKILELSDLYDHDLLDYFIGKAVEEDTMDIRSFWMMLKSKSREVLKPLTKTEGEKETPADITPAGNPEEEGLIRDLKYYDLAESGVPSNGK